MKPCIFSHIVAASSNNVIGFQNQLPWNIPEDLKFFKNKTNHHTCIMGRKTFESLGSPLPQRFNIVVSRNKNFKPQGACVVSTLDQAIEESLKKADDEVFIIGGGEIYKQSLDKIQKIYLTRVHKNYKGDAFYPEIPKDQFQLVHQEDHDGSPSFSFLTYEKIK